MESLRLVAWRREVYRFAGPTILHLFLLTNLTASTRKVPHQIIHPFVLQFRIQPSSSTPTQISGHSARAMTPFHRATKDLVKTGLWVNTLVFVRYVTIPLESLPRRSHNISSAINYHHVIKPSPLPPPSDQVESEKEREERYLERLKLRSKIVYHCGKDKSPENIRKEVWSK